MFKWNNTFSWTYSGGITDSIKQNVAKAGGAIEAALRFSIQWNEKDDNKLDMDLHAEQPDGTKINFSTYRGNKVTSMSGNLDVDITSPRGVAVENIVWKDFKKMKPGNYVMRVHNYSSYQTSKGFKAQIEFEGQIHDFEVSSPIKPKTYTDVAVVTLANGEFSIKPSLTGNSSISSSDKWNVSTYKYHQVTHMMLSPNYWDAGVGNKHFLFVLENCLADEPIRSFFNEYLNPSLNEHKKVFELVGGKLNLPESKDQLSGIGFSSTIRNEVHVKVKTSTGTTKNLKITI
jgi:hypothetical protein